MLLMPEPQEQKQSATLGWHQDLAQKMHSVMEAHQILECLQEHTITALQSLLLRKRFLGES